MTKLRGFLAEPAAALAGCCLPLQTSTLDEQSAADLARVFGALADPVRLRLLNLIATAPSGEVCACDLVAPVGKSQPTVSHHLKVLHEAGLVIREKRGIWMWFRADVATLEEVRTVLSRPGQNG